MTRLSSLRDPDGTGLVQHFYNHPLIYCPFSGDYVPSAGLKAGSLMITRGRNLPSYLPSSSFALALMDMTARGPQATLAEASPVTLESIRANIGAIENPAVQRAMQGDKGDVYGILCHHTAGAKTLNMPSLNTILQGRPDLPGPLAHLGLGRDGTYYVIAAGRCNHVGAGTWKA